MSIWSVHIDESGTHPGSRFITVGGAIARVGSWQILQARWLGVLSNYGLKTYHASSFNNLWGEFEKLTETSKNSCHKELLNELAVADIEYIVYALDTGEFDLVSQDIRGRKLTPYDYLLSCMVSDVVLWGEQNKSVSNIQVLIEAGSNMSAILCNELKLAAQKSKLFPVSHICRYDKKMIFGFQVADLIAYEAYKHLENALSRPDLPERRSLIAIRAGNPMCSYFLERNCIEKELPMAIAFLQKLGVFR